MVTPTKPPTPMELRIVFWGIALVMFIGGIIGVCVSFADVAAKLDRHQIWEMRAYSLLMIGLGFGLGIVMRILGRHTD